MFWILDLDKRCVLSGLNTAIKQVLGLGDNKGWYGPDSFSITDQEITRSLNVAGPTS